MKKIIRGKRYDTDTAKKLHEWSSDLPGNDFGFYEETLYRKKTGEYFLCGRGNAASKYARAIDENSWSAGARIIPLTEAEAREWMERHASSDEYEAVFAAGRIVTVKTLLIGRAGGTAGKDSQYYNLKLPAEMVRELGLSEGERCVKLTCEDGKITIEKVS